MIQPLYRPCLLASCSALRSAISRSFVAQSSASTRAREAQTGNRNTRTQVVCSYHLPILCANPFPLHVAERDGAPDLLTQMAASSALSRLWSWARRSCFQPSAAYEEVCVHLCALHGDEVGVRVSSQASEGPKSLEGCSLKSSKECCSFGEPS